ncbi:MAG: hypothetical protein WD851_23810 [Pirellulales bacterium]
MSKLIIASVLLSSGAIGIAAFSVTSPSNDNTAIPVVSPNEEALPEPAALARQVIVQQHKAALEARWRAERIEEDWRAAQSREMILREIHRDQEAKRQAIIERNKPRPVSVFTAPTVLIGGP